MSSTKPRTQRKRLYETLLHKKHATVSAHLSKELKAKLGTKTRSLSLRKGDRVKIMRGANKGKSGKISEVDLKRSLAFIEGVVVRKAKGAEVQIPFHASNLLIIEAGMDDKRRKKILDRKNRG